MFRLARPVHPGEILKAEFVEEQDLSVEQIAKFMGMPLQQLEKLLAFQLSVDANIAVKLALFARTSTQSWINLQKNYENSMDNQFK